MSIVTVGFWGNSWKRFKKNKSALIGFILIVLIIFIALFAYVIAPDNTPNADMQTIEIQAKEAGYKQWFLKLEIKKPAVSSFYSSFINGKPSKFIYIPISSYKTDKDVLFINKYVDDGITEEQRYSINEITNHYSKKINDCFILKTYWLGSDHLGRDILSRLIIGSRISLLVGLIAVLISLILGIGLGSIAGYFQGKIDACIMWLITVTWSIPTLLLVFAFTVATGKGFWQIFIAVGLTMWVNIARMVRAQVIEIKKLEYIESAKVMGFSNSRIIIKHILPNIMGPLMVLAAANFASAILIEAGLSFLGMGVQAPQPSWGLMIKENYTFIITNKAYLALTPGLAMMTLVLAFNLLGNGLRDALDIRST